MTTMMARVPLALLAVAVIAWLGVMLRDVREVASAGNTIFGQPPPTRPQFDYAIKRLQGAELLNLDPNPRLDRARYLFIPRRYDEALELARSVAKDEPKNLDAWVVVFQAGQIIDPAIAAQARAAILRLNPYAALPRR